MKVRILYALMIHLCLAGCLMASKNQDKEMKLTISNYKVACSGESVQLCYLIKKEDGKTEFFHDEIAGFDYQWGYNYTITVEKIINKRPMADASSFSYKLIKILKKEKGSTSETFELHLKSGDQQLVETKDGSCNYFGAIRIDTGKILCADLQKASSAIFRHAENRQALVLVSFK